MSAASRVIVLGGGVAGLEVASSLGRERDIAVTLVDRSPVHVWKPSLHEFAAGTIPHGGNCIPFTETAAKFGFTFRQTSPIALDRTAKTISFEDGSTESYDRLVVALGSRANDFGIPGVAENCLFMDNLVDADKLFSRFRTDLQEARASGSRLSLGVVGGGATGVQLIAELCQAIDDAPGLGVSVRKSMLEAVLIETGPRILPGFPETVSEQAKRQLEAIGVSVRTSAMVVSVEPDGFTLKSGERITSRLRIWAAGVKAADATSLFSDCERGRTGQLAVSNTLQTTLDPNIFAIGDCARIDSAPLAPTAQAARQEGQYVAKVLPRILAGETPAPFAYHDRGAVVALGDYNGWGMLDAKRSFGGNFLTGLGARLIHEGLYRQHQAGIVGLKATLLATLREHFAPLKPDLGA